MVFPIDSQENWFWCLPHVFSLFVLSHNIVYFAAAHSIEHWPVTSTHSGITYRNIYCAICNGALELADKPIGEGLNNLTTVDFWWSTTRCDIGTLEDLVRKRDLLARKEWTEFFYAALSNR